MAVSARRGGHVDTGPIRFLQLSGSPFERGVVHGAAVADALTSYMEELLRDVTSRVDRPLSPEELHPWIRRRADMAERVAPDLMEEVRGIAHGAQVANEVAIAVAFGEEVNQLASGLGYHPVEPREGRCLSVVVPPSGTSTGGYLLAQTWDGPDWTPDPVLFAVHEATGRSVFLADPGWVGGVGVNDRRIGSVHTGVLIEDNPTGLPYSFVARRILQAPDVTAAAASVMEAPVTAGCHYIAVQGDVAVDVEAAGRTFSRLVYDDLFSTCAHFAGDETAPLEARGGRAVSRYRTRRLAELVRAHGTVSPGDLMQLLSDHEEGPDGATVCRHRGDGRSLGAIVIDVDSTTVLAKAGNPCSPRPVREVALGAEGIVERVLALEART
jgi:isopenicillin-N N-acyltransferase-like protein